MRLQNHVRNARIMSTAVARAITGSQCVGAREPWPIVWPRKNALERSHGLLRVVVVEIRDVATLYV